MVCEVQINHLDILNLGAYNSIMKYPKVVDALLQLCLTVTSISIIVDFVWFTSDALSIYAGRAGLVTTLLLVLPWMEARTKPMPMGPLVTKLLRLAGVKRTLYVYPNRRETTPKPNGRRRW